MGVLTLLRACWGEMGLLASNFRVWSLLLTLLLSTRVTTVVAGSSAAPGTGSAVVFRALDLFPEGFDWDAKHERFLLGSTASGALLAVSTNGSVEEFVRDGEYAGRAAVLGVTVDEQNSRLLAVVQDLPCKKLSGLAAYDLDSRKRLFFTHLHRIGVDEGEKSCANDVAVDAAGNAYVTNCRSNFIWKVTRDGEPSLFSQHAKFTSQPLVVEEDKPFAWNGLNGIAYHRSGYLLVSQSNSGALFRLSVDDGSVHVVAMKERLPWADGIAFQQDGKLVVISTEKLWLVESADDWMAASVVDTVTLNASDYVTAVAVSKGSTFILPSHLSDHIRGQSRETFEVMAIKFRSSDNPLWLIGVLLVLIAAVYLLWRFRMREFLRGYKRKRA